jgi:alpha-methylacyl-CoA racemase
MHPAPAPRFSRTPSRIAGAPVVRGAGSEAALADWGVQAPAKPADPGKGIAT